MSLNAEMQTIPYFTFVIPILDEEHRIKRCLQSIRSQEYSQEKIDIIIADGGSSDGTLEVSSAFGVRVVSNPDRLAEFGLKRAMREVKSDLVVVFAADNELPERNWLSRVAKQFVKNEELAAVWGRITASADDPPINRYNALIQSEPLTYFVNKNLEKYIRTVTPACEGEPVYIFRVNPKRPLPWGANGTVMRTEFIQPCWDVEGYFGDIDAFQSMVSAGHDLVAYLPELCVLHHSVRSLRDWVHKWERNFGRHFIDHFDERDMSWAFPPDFRCRLAMWLAYSLVIPISLVHSVYLAVRDRNALWLYHPIVSFMQPLVYIRVTLMERKAREVLISILRRSKDTR